MKKRFAVLLTLALAASFIGGCGGTSGSSAKSSDDADSRISEETGDNEKNNDNSGFLSSLSSGPINGKERAPLSEYLSDGRAICYSVSKMDKDVTPKKAYFFEGGTLTIIPGNELGFTLGELSKMEDEEIWEAYMAARETYREHYVEEKETEIKNKMEYLINELLINSNMERLFLELNNAAERGISFQDYLNVTTDQKTTETINHDYCYHYLYLPCWTLAEYMGIDLEDPVLGIDEIRGIHETKDYMYTIASPLNSLAATMGFDLTQANGINEFIARCKEEIVARHSDEVPELSYKGPFYDLPFTFTIVTDSTGNHVKQEILIYATTIDKIDGEIPVTFYNEIIFPAAEGADIQIYDTMYNCIPLKENTLCTRAHMYLDTLDSKNVLIDPAEDELNELYREVVMARYE